MATRTAFGRFELGRWRGVSEATEKGAKCFNLMLDGMEVIYNKNEHNKSDCDKIGTGTLFERWELKAIIQNECPDVTGERIYSFSSFSHDDKHTEIDNVVDTLLASAINQRLIERLETAKYKVIKMAIV